MCFPCTHEITQSKLEIPVHKSAGARSNEDALGYKGVAPGKGSSRYSREIQIALPL